MDLRRKSLWMIEKSNRQIEFVTQPLIRIADGSAAFRAEGARDPSSFRERFQDSPEQVKLAWSIANPYRQWAANRMTTIVIMIIANPERITAHLGSDRATKARASFEPCAHAGIPSAAEDEKLLISP